MKKNLILLLMSVPVLTAHADWKTETINGLQTYFYVPKTTDTNKRALMVNLHGCAQKAEDLKKDGNWETTADEFNMIVALPKVPNGGVYSGCWDYYGADHTRTNRNNGPILDMVKDLLSRADLNIDPGQVYVSGLSSGGGESMVLGCLAPDVFAGMGLNAGPSTGTSANEISFPKTSLDKMLSTCKNLAGANSDHFKTQLTSIIYGNNDYIVNTAFDKNNAEIMSTVYSAKEKSSFDTKKLPGSSTEGTGTIFSDAVGPRISLIMNTNLGHNWPAGQGGNSGNFINKKSINYPAYLAKFFFENNRRSHNVRMPELLINGMDTLRSTFVVSGKATIPSKWINKIIVSVTKNGEEVDRFNATVKPDGEFEGVTKNLNTSGEYKFNFELVTTSGQVKNFFRPAWLGDVPGVMGPQIMNTLFESSSDCLHVKGQAVPNGGEKLREVVIEIDQTVIGKAEIEASTFWTFKHCGLAEGEHTLGSYAVNEADLKSSTQTFSFIIATNAATSSLQAHMESHRLKWEDYGLWYAKYGNKTFTLYKQADGSWSDSQALLTP